LENDLQIDAVAVQILDAPFHIPAGRIDSAEKAVAEQNIGFAALQVPDSGPVGRTVAVGKIGPRIGEEVSVDVNDHYFCSIRRTEVRPMCRRREMADLLNPERRSWRT